MFHRILTIVTALGAVICLTSCSDEDAAMQMTARMAPPTVGEKAPDFTLRTLDQQPFHLAARLARGPVVVVVLRGWPGYQCPICTRQVGEFMARANDLKAAGAQVVLIYPGPADRLPEHAHEFINNKTVPPPFSFVIDPDFRFTRSYGLRWDAPRETAYPSTFIVDRQGIIRFAKISKTHGNRAHIADVLQSLAHLKEG